MAKRKSTKLTGPALIRHLESELQRRGNELKALRQHAEDVRVELKAAREDAEAFKEYCEERVRWFKDRNARMVRAWQQNAAKLEQAQSLATSLFTPEPVGFSDGYKLPVSSFESWIGRRISARVQRPPNAIEQDTGQDMDTDT